MNDTHQIVGYHAAAAATSLSAREAKATLLNWADEVDTRSRASRPSLASIASMGGLAVLGSFAISRVLVPRRRGGEPASRVASVGARLISWTLVVRAAQFLLPIAIKAAQSSMNRRTAK